MFPLFTERRVVKKPIYDRFFWLVAISFAFPVTSTASAETTITEQDVIEKALGEASLQKISDASGLEERSKAIQLRQWTNPSLGYEIESVGAEQEHSVTLHQTIRLSGRDRLMAKARESLARAGHLSAKARALGHASNIREEFFGLVEAQDRLEVYEQWLSLMKAVDGELERRVAAGESAPYERLRLKKEVADIESRAGEDRAAIAGQKLLLARLLDLQKTNVGEIRAVAQLLPETIPNENEISALFEQRPEIQRERARLEAAELFNRAAARWWIPNAGLEGGFKTVGDQNGFVLGPTIGIPLFTNGKSSKFHAESIRLLADGEHEFITHHDIAEAVGLAGRIVALKEAIEVYETDGIETAQKVVETATLAYRAGELGILELLDGYRGLVEARLRAVEMSSEAREAEIEMWRLIGGANREKQNE